MIILGLCKIGAYVFLSTMRGFQTGPAKSRRGCFLIILLLAPLIVIAMSFLFPSGEIIEHYNQLDRERQMELEELETRKGSSIKNHSPRKRSTGNIE